MAIFKFKKQANEENVQITDAETRVKKALIKNKIISLIPIIALVVLALLYIITTLAKGYVLKNGFTKIVSSATLVALVATGATCIFSAGSFDLSLGSNMLLSACIGGLVGIKTNNVFAMLIVCVVMAVGLSVLNSVLASTFKLPVFIMTIVMMNVFSVLANLVITKLGANAKISVPMDLVEALDTTWFRLILIAVYVGICCFFFYFSKLGRRQRFLGGNPFCSFLTGIKSTRITIISFALAGLGIGLASFSLIVSTPTLSSSSGSSVGMNMLIALVFGGMVMSGGPKSKMYAAVIGAFSMSFLDAFMNNFISGDWYLQIVKGVLFAIVVYAVSKGNKINKLLER